jgi:predicted permease
MIRSGVRRFFRLALRRDDVIARNVDDEIRTHLVLRAEQLEREGFPLEAAREEAVRRFGPVDAARRGLQARARRRERTLGFREWLEDVRQDVRYALRGLRREPLFTAFVVATLALGIGANAAMFGVADRLLLHGPERIVDAARVMRVYEHGRVPGQGDFTGGVVGYVMYDALAHGAHSFAGVAAYVASPDRHAVLGHGADAMLIQQGEATAGLFPLLGVTPALGRFFTSAEDSTAGAARVAVLGYGLWRRVYGGDRAVLGKTILLGDLPYTIVGVAPDGFTGPQFTRVDVWLPASLHVSMMTDDWTHTWHAQWLHIVARLKPGVTPRQASVDATAAYRHAYTGGDKDDAAADLFVAPLSYSDDGREPTEVSVSRWLVGVAFIVLLIACSNVVNLLLARAVRRRREVAVRLALGAARRRLVQLLLTESMTLALLGGSAGLAVAWGTARLMRSIFLSDVEWTSSPVSGRVLAVSAGLTLIVGIIVGLVPALRSSRADLTASLKSGVREGGPQGTRLRTALTVAQAALSVVLLAGAGLFIRSLSNVRAVDLGIEPSRVVVVSARWPRAFSSGTFNQATLTAQQARTASVYARALDAVRRMPRVERASLSIGLPFESSFSGTIRVSGLDSIPPMSGGYPQLSAVGPDYFQTVGTPLLRGRAFTPTDRAGSEPVTIVSDRMARVLWPGRAAIGQCIFTGPLRDSLTTCMRIVGVVGDVHRSRLKEAPGTHYYIPIGQERGIGGTALVVRPRGNPATVIPDIRRALETLDPTIEYVDAATLQRDVDPQVRPWRLGATVFGLMGTLALLVAAMGLYSVMSYLVAQRAHELGVRIALGAQARDIVALVVRGGAAMAALGVVIGVGLALAAGRFIEPLLFETSPHDVGVLAGVSFTLFVVALLASAVPALRAKATDPMEALRAE